MRDVPSISSHRMTLPTRPKLKDRPLPAGPTFFIVFFGKE